VKLAFGQVVYVRLTNLPCVRIHIYLDHAHLGGVTIMQPA